MDSQTVKITESPEIIERLDQIIELLQEARKFREWIQDFLTTPPREKWSTDFGV